MEATISIPSHCMVTIRLPNGEIETMNYTAATKGQVVEMSPKTMKFVNGLMEKAGRGRIVDYENVSKEVPRPEKPMIYRSSVPCPRCGTYCFGDCAE